MLKLDPAWLGNPFRKKSELLENGTIHWKSDAPVTALHILPIYKVSLNFKRRLNVNTGTHGDPDGSTIFYHTPRFRKEVRENKKNWKDFLKDCN